MSFQKQVVTAVWGNIHVTMATDASLSHRTILLDRESFNRSLIVVAINYIGVVSNLPNNRRPGPKIE